MARHREHRHCEHYSGRDMVATDNTVCRAGVDALALVGGERFGWITRVPCLEGNTACTVTCEKREFPDWEVVRERDAEMDRRMTAVLGVMKLIPKKGTSGAIDCPLCKGPLDWSRSSYNGHVWGKCRTADCISWMQ